MKLRFAVSIILLLVLSSAGVSQQQEGRVRSFMQGRIDIWEVTLHDTAGNFEAYMKDDVNRWTFEIGSMKGEVNTQMNDKLNKWDITIGKKTYTLQTKTPASWSMWELSGGDMKSPSVFSTLYANSWDNWEMVSDSSHCDITTYMNGSWNDWEIKGDLNKMTEGERVAAVFIPIFVSRVYRPKIAK